MRGSSIEWLFFCHGRTGVDSGVFSQGISVEEHIQGGILIYPISVIGLRKHYVCWKGVLALPYCIQLLRGCAYVLELGHVGSREQRRGAGYIDV